MTLYLQEVLGTDIDLLNKFNNGFNNKKGWVSEDRFTNLLHEWKNDLNDITRVHFYPFWLIDNNIVIGLVIIKNNIEVDEFWKIHGGNISYVIMPQYRRKGYGTKALNLALEKCKEMGINEVLITCNDDNIGSIKIIEKNGGLLNDKCTTKDGKLERRYYIK